MNRLDELGIPYKRVTRNGVDTLLVTDIYSASDRECEGCYFNSKRNSDGHCFVRWRFCPIEKHWTDNHKDCMYGRHVDVNANPHAGCIYIVESEIEQYLAARAVAILEGDDDE